MALAALLDQLAALNAHLGLALIIYPVALGLLWCLLALIWKIGRAHV